MLRHVSSHCAQRKFTSQILFKLNIGFTELDWKVLLCCLQPFLKSKVHAHQCLGHLDLSCISPISIKEQIKYLMVTLFFTIA
jgi:hypothetical protein